MEAKEMFDVVICVGPKDEGLIKKQLKYTKPNIVGYRNIYLISKSGNLQIKDTVDICEEKFPFSLKSEELFGRFGDRKGWYFQQLLKLYAGSVIPGILGNYLVIDADTFFLKPTRFFDGRIPLYNYGTENHEPYFHHMKKLK